MTWVVNGFTSIQQYTGVVYSVIMILLLIFLPAGLALRPDQRARVKALFRREKLQEVALAGVSSAIRAPGGWPATSHAQDRAGPVHQRDPLVEDLSVYFGGLKAVDEVSLQVPAGGIVALIGPNAGKTAFFNAIIRLQKLTTGTVRLPAGMSTISLADTARLGMARTFQNLRSPNMTVLENILVGCHRHERSGLWAGGFGCRISAEKRSSRGNGPEGPRLCRLDALAHLPAASLPMARSVWWRSPAPWRRTAAAAARRARRRHERLSSGLYQRIRNINARRSPCFSSSTTSSW
jgi:hypothetical protein